MKTEPLWGMDPEKWLILCWGGRWIVHPPIGEGDPTDHDTFEDARTHFLLQTALPPQRILLGWKQVEEWHGKAGQSA